MIDRAADALLAGKRVLVVAATFPNRIQPWMLNTTIQAIEHGAEVFVAAGGRRGRTYQAAVDRYGLIERTMYVNPSHVVGLFRPFGDLLGGKAGMRQAAARGLPSALARFRLADLRGSAKELALAVPMGTPGLSLIHSHAMSLGYEFLRLAKAKKIPIVQTFHGAPPVGVEGLQPEKEQELWREASRFLVNTQFAKGLLVDRGCPPGKIDILPQGTNLAEFPFAPREHPGAGPVRILTVGRLHEDKGHRYALQALSSLSRRGLEFEYRVVGVGPDREKLRALSEELGIGGHVAFTGEVDDDGLRREYQEAHLFLFPSLRDLKGKHEETQGVALQEAQASGCIAIATRTGGIPECVDESHARLVTDRDADALAEAILDVMARPERWPEWQAAGRRWVEDRYSVDVIGRRLAELYLTVLGTEEAVDSTRPHPELRS